MAYQVTGKPNYWRSHEDHDSCLLDVGALSLARDLCLVTATPTAVTTTARCCR